jgi:histidyl-tRNA synthetase
MTLLKTPYKGTRDFYPEDLRVRKYIFEKWAEVCESFGFLEYATPILEPLEVYAAKSGEELVNEQTYAFDDRGGRRVAIRPEMTPSVSRLVAARRQELGYPARLYSIANFMRYERAQRGREREFWQLNVDVFGDDSLAVEAETIYLAEKILKSFGADGSMFEIRVNDRRLIDFVMKEYLGLSEVETAALVRLLDKINKMPSGDFERAVKDLFGKKRQDEVWAKLDAVVNAQAFEDIPEEIVGSAEFGRVRELFRVLTELGVESAIFDITLMRGLDYYTGTVFEVFDLDPENNRSMFGGGRYDGLVGMFGVEAVSAVGFAPGLTTTELFLKSHGLVPKLAGAAEIGVALVGQEFIGAAVNLSEKLRAEGKKVDLDAREVKLEKKFRGFEKKGIGQVIVFGEAEAESGEYEVRDLGRAGD